MTTPSKPAKPSNAATPSTPPPPDPRELFVETEIRAQLDRLQRDNASVDPAAIARALDPEKWKRWMASVRDVARRMAARGEIEVTRHGKPVTEWPWRGVVRLRRPRAALSAETATEPTAPDAPSAAD